MKLTQATSRMCENRGPVTSTIKILLVDDHELLRAGVRSLVSETAGFTVVGEASDKDQAIARARHEQPDVILLNIELKAGDGLEMVPELFAASNTSRLAVLTGSRDPEVHRRAILLGALGIISKDDPPSLLSKAITRVYQGGAWLDRAVTGRVIGELSKPNKRPKPNPDAQRIATLTEREREVITLLGSGLRNKQIAERLFISDITVHHHLTSIYSKLELTDKFELLIYAYRHGLAEVPR